MMTQIFWILDLVLSPFLVRVSGISGILEFWCSLSRLLRVVVGTILIVHNLYIFIAVKGVTSWVEQSV